MTDSEWYESVKSGSDEGWKLVWEKVVSVEAKTPKNREMMTRFSLTDGDLMGMLYSEMIGRGKIGLYRNDGGSFQGWLRTYVRGFIKNADPNKHGEISIENAHADSEDGDGAMEIPTEDRKADLSEVWHMTHLCFKDLWNAGASIYIHSEQLKSLNYAIGQITAGGIKRAGASAAATVVMMLVPISVFVVSQSNIIETMGSSGMKD